MPRCDKHKINMKCAGGCSSHPDNWYCPICDQENATDKELPIHKTSDQELLELIYDDLKMRVSDEGLVNISGFIWTRLSKRVNKK